MSNQELVTKTKISIRFNEVDSMRIVWHGNYIKYFEDGREDFGKRFGISYMDILKEEFMTPVVKLSCDFIKPLKYGDETIVETRFVNSDAAKIIYSFRVLRASDNELVATGESIQVFLNMNGELVLNNPPFFKQWKKKWKIRK